MKNQTRLQLLVTSKVQRISPRHRCCQLKHIYVQTLIRMRLISMWSRNIAARRTLTNRTCSTACWSVGCVPTELVVHEDPGPESIMERKPNSFASPARRATLLNLQSRGLPKGQKLQSIALVSHSVTIAIRYTRSSCHVLPNKYCWGLAAPYAYFDIASAGNT